MTPPEWTKGSSQDVAWNAWVVSFNQIINSIPYLLYFSTHFKCNPTLALFSIIQNHGGGDIFMLCKKTDFDACRDNHLPTNIGLATRSEKDGYLQCVWNCFESQVLEFDDSPQRLQFQDDVCSYAKMYPLEKEGKNGSIFRYTPIPDSLQVTNKGEGACMWDSVFEFSNDKVMDEFVESFGSAGVCDFGKDAHSPKDWNVVDKVKIPTHLEDGEYLLSWRWDAFTADQMWTNCADVKITSTPSTTPSVFDDGHCAPVPTKQPTSANPTPYPSKMTPPDSHPTFDVTCPTGYTGIRPHDSCTKYFHCNNGEVVADAQPCPAGTLFDTTYSYCNWENQVTCELGSVLVESDLQPPSVSGCYSNNYKTCNHPDFQSGSDSCASIWLPDGEQHDCIPLWSECTGNSGGCCGPAICYGDAQFAQCRPNDKHTH